jgi:hypothetical protein
MVDDSANAIMEQVLTKGDLSKLSQADRNSYYMATCRSLGLNPLTRPFEYIVLNGKLTLYARRDAADQLRKINGISIEILSRELHGDILTVAVRARDGTGRTDEDLGCVNLGKAQGEMRANLVLKCVTKAKRRVTLSICGLGFLDETEVEDIPGKSKSVYEPEDYADGTPEKDTKPPEQKTYSRNPNWMALQVELKTMINNGASPVELTNWGSEVEHKIRNWPPEPRQQWQRYIATQIATVIDNTIERDGELQDVQEESASISERANALRDGSKHKPLTPDEIADYLKI